MRSKALERVLSTTPKEIEVLTDLYGDLLARVSEILKERGITHETAATSLGNEPSEIRNWLNGDFSFSLQSIARLSVELGEPLLEVPSTRKSK